MGSEIVTTEGKRVVIFSGFLRGIRIVTMIKPIENGVAKLVPSTSFLGIFGYGGILFISVFLFAGYINSISFVA